MTPKLSIIAASIRKALGGLAGDIGKYADEYWDSVVLALRGNVPAQDFKAETVLNMHMDGADPDWSSVVLGMHMGGGEVDPYWSNVSLLMLMNGTNGSTAIGDVTGKTVTVAGNAQISTTQSKFGGSSCYLDGTGDYVTVSGTEGLLGGVTDFTIEFWVYSPLTQVGTPVGKRTTGTTGWAITIEPTGELKFRGNFGAWSDTVGATGAGAVAANTWTHIACVRSGNILIFFANGAIKSVTTIGSGSLSVDTTLFQIGRSNSTGENSYLGYIDNIRVTSGLVRYTDNFTPPNREFPAGATTIYDVKGHPVSVVGNTAVVATQSRFGGYSCYFDGSGDYLTVPIIGSEFTFTGDFTIEAWVLKTNNSNPFHVLDTRSGGNYTDYVLAINGSNQIDFVCAGGGGVRFTAGYFPPGVWGHLAFVRVGGVMKAFVNGTLVSGTVTYASTLTPATSSMSIGASRDPYYANGYIDDLRITKGVARYTAAFTPPSRAFPHDVAFYDEKGLVPDVTGAPTISTATLKYGYGSASFNGTTDYLTFDASSTFGLGANDFTIEAWVKTSAAGTLLDFRNYAADYGHFYLATGGYLAFDHTYGAIVGTTTVTDNNWHHVAFVRYKNILTLYVDGLDTGAAIANANIGSNRQARVGAKVDGTNFFAGNLDELRVTKVARYVGEFTPQRYQFDDANNNVIWRDETGTKTVTANGNAQVYPATYKYGNGSMYFDGTGDYLKLEANSDFNLGSGDFTWEAWICRTAVGEGSYADAIWCSVTSPVGFAVGINPDGKIGLAIDSSAGGDWDIRKGVDPGDPRGSTAIPLNTWTHIAVTRLGSVFTGWVNGALDQTFSSTLAISNASGGYYIAHWHDAWARCFLGFIDDLRITKGVARYVSSFTPPVRQNANYGLPAIYDPYWDAVVLGMHMDGADNGTTFTDVKGKTVTVNGNAQTKTATKKFGTASAYFDGTGDYLVVPNSADLNFGTGDFTIELWFNKSSTSNKGIFHMYSGIPNPSVDGVGVGYDGTQFQIYAQNANNGTGAFTLIAGAWYHLALVRSSGSTRLYVNGVQLGSAVSHAANISGNQLNIGLYYDPTFTFDGYIDDLRITRGVARYTANFQPAQYAFPETRTPVKTYLDPYYDNVVLNMHMNGPSGSTAFVDEKGHTVKVYGNASVSTAQSVFGGTSAYFDGTGDGLYIDTPYSSVGNLSGDYTIELWVYWNTLPPGSSSGAERVLLGQMNWPEGAYAGWWSFLGVNYGCQLYYGNGTARVDYTFAWKVNTWYHLALCRSGTSTSLYVNGTLVGTGSTTGALMQNNSRALSIGSDTGGDVNASHAYFDDIRITDGVARYTSNFTVPTLPNPDFKTAPAATDPYWKNVVLHMPMNGADAGTTFVENTGKTITVNGNTSTQVEQYRFGGSSAYFDGTGDYLYTTDASLAFGTGDFTVEAWVNPANVTNAGVWQLSTTSGGFATTNRGCVMAFNSGGGGLTVSYGATDSFVTVTIPTNTWTHLAMSRFGTSLKVFVNGEVKATFTDTTNYTSAYLVIGGYYSTSYFFTGYIDDLRITKGVARYTANFTPPSLPNPTGYDPYAPNVVLHLPLNANWTESTGKTVTVSGNSVIVSTNKKLGTGSAYFDGSGDKAVVSSTELNFGTGDFTIELWTCFDGIGFGYPRIIEMMTYPAVTGWTIMAQNASSTPNLYATNNSATLTTTYNLVVGKWVHIALTRSSGTVRLFADGVQIGSVASDTTNCSAGYACLAGGNASGDAYKGYIADVRLTKGVARYTANFNPPREPFSLT